jgi:hypothetical protein
MIAIGMPKPIMRDGAQQRNREQGDGNGDIAVEAIQSIIDTLHEGGPSAVRDLRAYTSALEDMCQAHMDKDYAGLEEAASNAVDAIRDLIS